MILRVDLSTGTVGTQGVDRSLVERYIGGRGLGAHFLTQWQVPGTDPLGPDNPLIFLTGPLTGTNAPTSGRISLTTKSPLTGSIFDANAGGQFGARLSQLDITGLIVTGKASGPIYLLLSPDGIEIRDAAVLWGLDVPATGEELRKAGAVSHAVIGQAGERLVKFSSIVVEGGRAFGRGGVGAVMGSKNLKAIAVTGTPAKHKVQLNDEGLFDFFVYEANKIISANPITSQALPQFGTAMLVNLMNRAGAFPARNFQSSSFEDAAKLSGEAITKRILERRSACYGCTIACGRKTKTARSSGEGPEYETVWALGANLGIADLEAVAEANYLCNRYGLDTISTGVTIAAAMELASSGAADFPLAFGKSETVFDAIEKIARREDYGAELAEGSRAVAAAYNKPEVALQVKGQELPAYDPRVLKGQALALATSNRGGCHLRGNMLGYEVLGVPKMVSKATLRGKAGLLIVLQHLFAVLDSLVMCKFSAFALNEEHYARMLSAASGLQVEAQELLEIGERIWNLERLFNIREGFTREDDRLPSRVVPDGFEGMLDEYYRFRGWDGDGVPSPEKLARLGLREAALDAR
ncbi:MAG: aldehyde ferredoxin oxidoreductase family protein [Chloroflexi bacterium]|nr:aldehyde ferredoxin oxidoreductase family protein [Chloroflexota bacterium]